MLYILIPSCRELGRVQRLIDSLSYIEIPYVINMVRNNFLYKEELVLTTADPLDFNQTLNLSTNLGDLYKELYDSVPIGEYFLFLEDDDFLIQPIVSDDVQTDVTTCGYRSKDNVNDSINWQSARRMYNIRGDINVFSRYEKLYGCFQISCFIAKKKSLEDDVLVWDNNLSNDYKLFDSYLNKAESIHYKRGALFEQTVLDNISFPSKNKDSRWEM